MTRLYFALAVILVTTVQSYAQPGISSPYSAYGIGYLSEVNNTRSRLMGGIGIGLRDNFTVNIKNPASYTAFDSTSFIFEGGISGFYMGLKTNDLREEIINGSLSHILMGFPITKWWRGSFGLLPFSGVGYSVVSHENKEDIGNIRYKFEGSGGISRFYWGNAFKPSKLISFGVNASYLFGTIDRSHSVSFPDSLFYISAITNNTTSIRDLYFDFGVQFHKEIRNNLELVVGGTFNPKINLNAKRDYLTRTYFGEINNIEIITDTVAYYPEEKGTIVIPYGFGLGFSLAKAGKWLFGADYKFDNWGEYKSFGLSDSLTNSHSFAVGGQVVPNQNSTSYIKRMDYRFGARYSQSYLKLHGEQINEFGITFGVGLPIKRVSLRGATSMINIGAEIGRRGKLDNNLIQENFVNFYVSVSIYEWWFFKRRYK